MDPEKIAELEAATAAAKQAAEAAGGTDEALNKALSDSEAALTAAKTPSQDPLDQAIARENKRGQRTEAEKAEYNLKKLGERATELGLDPAKILGLAPASVDNLDADDDKPVTRGELRRIQMQQASETAMQMAESIEDPRERELAKSYLKRVVPSGDPAEDLRFARLAVNSEKTGLILQEAGRARPAQSHTTGTGAPAKSGEDTDFQPTPTEQSLMRPPFNLSQKDVLDARKQAGL